VKKERYQVIINENTPPFPQRVFCTIFLLDRVLCFSYTHLIRIEILNNFFRNRDTSMDKSTVKKDYKQTKRVMGVYRIRNTRSEKSYIGFSIDLTSRINRHKSELKFGSHRNVELSEEWISLGESAFEFEVLDKLDHKEDSQASPVEELRILAEMWIRKLENTGSAVLL
jgi:hypothetical protein